MKNLLLASFLFVYANSVSQVEPMWDHGNLKENEDNEGHIVYKIKGKKYHFYDNYILFKNDTLFKTETEDITYHSLYKKRYIFISYYPIEQKRLSFGFSLRKLGKLDIVDLKPPYKKWHYDFSILEQQQDLRVGLGDIADFDPESGEIIFLIKFSVNVKSEFQPIQANKNDGDY